MSNTLNYVSYKKDGLELFIANDGQVYATQSAMARMLGMQQGHLSSVLKRPLLPTSTDIETSLTLVLPSAQGNREQTLYGVSTIVTLASRYSPALATKFAEMGATMYLYQLAGYKVAATAPVAPEPDDYTESLKTAYDALGKLMNLHTFAADKPGLSAYLKLAEEPKDRQLSGKMTLGEMAEHYGITMSSEDSRQVGRSMAGVGRSQEAQDVTLTRKRFKDASGNHQSYLVREYSVDYLPLFKSLCQAYNIV